MMSLMVLARLILSPATLHSISSVTSCFESLDTVAVQTSDP
jgi:hypothetical protein